ncbi:MAG: polyphosphate kinase 1, partial [Akkermansia sp.]|nr:polyphosphate kinase 1 [Akkermansia sp.]
SMFDNIAQGDILIHNPFESYEPVVRFVEEAAADPDVVAIKQVLYRTARNSRFVAALCRAAESGKQVTVLVELKARFDESRNLMQAEQLQKAGVQVVYGVKGFKTHAKITLVVRRENGTLRRYCHFGTGNYNETTAALYSDLNLLTCNENLGADASQFFNSITGLTRLMRFRSLFPSPGMMKKRLLELIAAETERARRGEPAEIRAKMNSLNDKEVMQALEDASQAGVRINLNVRGICCWTPGTPQGRVRTRIISIIDRYLEHARIFCFANSGSPLVYIASADWMSRNLDRRVELMVPIENPELATRVQAILDACFNDTAQAYVVRADGTSVPVTPPPRTKPFAMQQHLQELAWQSARTREQEARQTLEPHRPRK